MQQETKRKIQGILLFIIITAIAVLLATSFFVVIPVLGNSMSPTVEDTDNVLLLKKVSAYERGDIVVFQGEKRLIKRIIGVAGDTVELVDEGEGVLRYYVNGELLADEYVKDGVYAYEGATPHKITIASGEFYYLGDNRGNSEDSGRLRAGDDGEYYVQCGLTEAIIGKVILRYNLDGKFVIKGV